MTDHEKLQKVAANYHELMVMQKEQRVLMATLIRACLPRLRSPAPSVRAEATNALADLATMLENLK